MTVVYRMVLSLKHHCIIRTNFFNDYLHNSFGTIRQFSNILSNIFQFNLRCCFVHDVEAHRRGARMVSLQ
jgi:hypothetical protein